jgi:hypothetical protein
MNALGSNYQSLENIVKATSLKRHAMVQDLAAVSSKVKQMNSKIDLLWRS